MRNAGIKAIVVGAIAAGVLSAPAASQAAPNPNPWLQQRFLNIAHQGGEDEVPSATMYALKSAMTEGGADMLEIDVQRTSDGHLIVMHDDTYSRTSCLPNLCQDEFNDEERPLTQVRDMTLAEVQELDAAYWFRKSGAGPAGYGRNYNAPASEFPFRGVRTGVVPPPPGYTAEDFRTPTLREVMDAFPNVPINIEIKMPKSVEPANPYKPDCVAPPGDQVCDDLDLTVATTQALIDFFTDPANPHRDRTDVIVVSFAEPPMDQFHAGAPHIYTAPSEEAVLGFFANPNNPMDPDPAVFQVPTAASAPNILLNDPFYDVHGRGYALHVFTSNANEETPAAYADFVSMGVDGLMTSRPRALHAYLCAAGVRRPDGSARCAAQDAVTAPPVTSPPVPAPAKKVCKKGQKLKKGKCVKKKKKKKKGKAKRKGKRKS